jgi:hypothetical protein
LTEPRTPQDEQLAALEAQCTFVASGRHQADEPAQQIVTATTLRMLDTTRAIIGLIGGGLPIQAAMLLRPLFEDMVVSHWLIDQDDPTFLVNRFLDQQDAIALHQHRLARETNWSVGTPLRLDVSDIRDRESELIETFGRAVGGDWWGVDAEGSRVGLRDAVERLEASQRYVPRFAGGAEPLLIRWYKVVQKIANQHLHHTSVGLRIRLTRDERVPAVYTDQSLPFYVLFCAYWTFAQQIYLQLLIEGYSADGFNALFAEGFNTFGRFLRDIGRDIGTLTPTGWIPPA